MFLLIICNIILFILLITLNILNITSLIIYNLDATQDFCAESNIWFYILVSVIISNLYFLLINFIKKDQNEYLIYIHLPFGFFFIAMIIWGIIELFENKCDNEFYRTLIFGTGLFDWLSYLIITGINLFLCIKYIF